MNAKRFPFLRSRWTNEHIQAALFTAILISNVPCWLSSPVSTLSFSCVLTIALILDAVINAFRYKRPVCAVSAAVTAVIMQTVTAGVPLWIQLTGVATALVAGKHVQGGTGKNFTNPAVLGLLAISLISPVPDHFFTGTPLQLITMFLFLPFIVFRPFAAISFIVFRFAAMLLIHSPHTILVSDFCEILFWGCLVLTDPVTSTRRQLFGTVGGIFIAITPVLLERFNHIDTFTIMMLSILAYNMFSRLIDNIAISGSRNYHGHIKRRDIFRIKSPIVINCCGEEETVENTGPFSPEYILNAVKNSGVFGMGGAGFPVHKKIVSVLESSSTEKFFIINAVECDPGLIHDRWIVENRPEQIEKGIESVCRCISFTKTILAISKGSRTRMMHGRGFEVVTVDNIYPAGAERLLIRRILNKEIPSHSIPSALGILVLNVQTVCAIHEAVATGRKTETRFCTVADLRKRTAHVVKVRVGMSITEAAGKSIGETSPLFAGGGIMNASPVDGNERITPNTNFIGSGPYPSYKESPLCSRCGFCSRTCPSGIDVRVLAENIDRGTINDAVRHEINRCIDCGNCSYICLAGRDPASRIRDVKSRKAAVTPRDMPLLRADHL